MLTSSAEEEKATEGIVVSDSCLGTGAFGAVYLGFDSSRGSQVAVKEVPLMNEADDALPQHILNEISIMRQASHPNVVRYIGARVAHSQRSGRVVQVVMEYIAGGSIGRLVRRVGALRESVAVMYVRDVIAGLAYLHDTLGIAHRDIKSENILVSPDGSCKLSDYGTSKAVATEPGRGSTLLTSCVGSPNYMAPEVARGDAYGRAADIWSVGCVVVELLTGEAPTYGAGNPMALMYRLADDPSAIPELPSSSHASPEAIEFVRMCCMRTPAERATAARLKAHPWIAGALKGGVPKPHAATAPQGQGADTAGQPTSLFPGAEEETAAPQPAVACQRCDIGIALFTCDECRRMRHQFNLCPVCWNLSHGSGRANAHAKRPLLLGRQIQDGTPAKAAGTGILLAGGAFVDGIDDCSEDCPVCGEPADEDVCRSCGAVVR
jgi:hypothetical protein